MQSSSQVLTVRRLINVCVALVAVVGGVYFFNVAAKTDDVKNTAEPDITGGGFIISGRVAHSNLPLSGVTVNLTGTTNAATTTDTAGNYQFSSLPIGGNYRVSPSFPRHYFTLPNRTINNLTSNQTGVNFEVLGVCSGARCVKNGKIAFVRNGEIYTINPDGTGETNITNNAATDITPDYSPDGTKIVFMSNRDGNNEIYRMNADGSDVVRLTNDATSDVSPRYSPDGSTIVFGSFREDGISKIFKMNADGSNQVRVTNPTSPAQDFFAAYSPDGSRMVVAGFSAQSGSERAYRMNADGTDRQVLQGPQGSFPDYGTLEYSLDGSTILFTFNRDFGLQHPSIWTMDAVTGGGVVEIYEVSRDATYSPDGTAIVFTCCTFNNTNRVYISDLAGSLASRSTLVNTTGNSSPDWQPLPAPRPAQFDFDSDGRSDVSVFRPSNGVWYLLRSTAGFTAFQWGVSSDVLVPADYDGDLQTDIAVWRPTDGYFYILNSFDNTVRAENFGLSGDIPTGGDWDADGKADPAVYRAGAQSYFYYRGSMGNPQGIITFVPWGSNGDKPVVGDYDGDGRADAAVYRGGNWYILQSSNSQLFAVNFGLPSDMLVPDDYDGDGKTDPAIYRDGLWAIYNSSNGSNTILTFGQTGDKPVAADYDGDGKADVAVFRPSDGTWYMLRSTSGFQAITFGASTDMPAPNAFVR